MTFCENKACTAPGNDTGHTALGTAETPNFLKTTEELGVNFYIGIDMIKTKLLIDRFQIDCEINEFSIFTNRSAYIKNVTSEIEEILRDLSGKNINIGFEHEDFFAFGSFIGFITEGQTKTAKIIIHTDNIMIPK